MSNLLIRGGERDENEHMKSDANITKVLNPQDRGENVLCLLVQNKDFPYGWSSRWDWICGLLVGSWSRGTGCVEIQEGQQSIGLSLL